MLKKVDKFINSKSLLPKIIVIYWPTASGKTALSIEVAKLLKSEIIWADSRQIYKLLNIGTGKITQEEKNWIPHHLIDFLDIKKDYSVAEYRKEAEKIINKIHSQNKIPVICGWTWLYLDAVVFNFDIPEIAPDWQYREELENIRIEKWNEFIWEMLNEVDSEYASELEKNNYRYVIRWLEIYRATGKSKKELKVKLPPKYEILFLTPYNWDRAKLYEKINSRIDEMFESGLIEEVQNILNKWYTKSDYGLNTIWYKEVISYLQWEITLEEAKNLIKQHNRNYAKRQLTWFRRYEN